MANLAQKQHAGLTAKFGGAENLWKGGYLTYFLCSLKDCSYFRQAIEVFTTERMQDLYQNLFRKTRRARGLTHFLLERIRPLHERPPHLDPKLTNRIIFGGAWPIRSAVFQSAQTEAL